MVAGILQGVGAKYGDNRMLAAGQRGALDGFGARGGGQADQAVEAVQGQRAQQEQEPQQREAARSVGGGGPGRARHRLQACACKPML